MFKCLEGDPDSVDMRMMLVSRCQEAAAKIPRDYDDVYCQLCFCYPEQRSATPGWMQARLN